MNRKITIIAMIAVSFCLGGSIPTMADDTVNQVMAQKNTQNKNHKGSDDSMDEAENNGMKALMNLAALNIPGAVTKGLKAYDNYQNSNRLDDLEAKTKANASRMQAYGTGNAAANGSGADESGASRNVSNILERRENSRLYQGELGETAAEFERRSGMKREEFVAELHNAIRANYNINDPQLVEKLNARFDAFVEKIPNPDFKQGLKNSVALVPPAARVQIMGEVVGIVNSVWGNNKPTLAESIFGGNGKDNAAEKAKQDAALAEKAAKPSDTIVARDVASVAEEVPKSTITRIKEKIGMFIGLKADSRSMIENFFQTDSTDGGDTLFVRVSNLYRAKSPGLLGKDRAAN